MAFPVAQIRYALETTEACWREIASIIDADLSTHFISPTSSPFNHDYSINGELFSLTHRGLRPGIVSFSCVSPSEGHQLNGRNFIIATFFDLITMSPYPKSTSTFPISSPHLPSSTSAPSSSSSTSILSPTSSETPNPQPIPFNALDFDQDWHTNNILEQDKIPHNNIILRILWLLCDILRIIRSLPLPLTHPCIEQLKHISSYLWAPLHSALQILFQFPFLEFAEFYNGLWAICPTHPKLILKNITIPLKHGKVAYYCELFEKFLMLPLPFLRELYPYQAYFMGSNQHNKPHPKPNSIPTCNKHSPNNFFLLLSQYQLLSPPAAKDDMPFLFSGRYLTQPPNSQFIDEFHTTFRQKVLEKREMLKVLCPKTFSLSTVDILTPIMAENLSSFSQKDVKMNSNLNVFQHSSEEIAQHCIIDSANSDQDGLSQEKIAPESNPEDFKLLLDTIASNFPHITMPLLSIPDLIPIVGADLLIPFIFAEAEEDPEDPQIFDRYPLPFSSIQISSDLSFSVAQIWKLFFQLLDLHLPTSGDAVFLIAQLFHQFKLLSNIKDHIERSILSIYWDGGEHLLYQQMKPYINALQNSNKALCSPNDPQIVPLQIETNTTRYIDHPNEEHDQANEDNHQSTKDHDYSVPIEPFSSFLDKSNNDFDDENDTICDDKNSSNKKISINSQKNDETITTNNDADKTDEDLKNSDGDDQDDDDDDDDDDEGVNLDDFDENDGKTDINPNTLEAEKPAPILTQQEYLNQMHEKEFQLGINLLKFLHPITSHLIPQTDLNFVLILDSFHDDSILEQDLISEKISNTVINPMIRLAKHNDDIIKLWQTSNLKNDILPRLAPLTKKNDPYLNCVLFKNRNFLSWQLHSGTEFRAHDLWQTLAWPLYAYFELSAAYRALFALHEDHMTTFLLTHNPKTTDSISNSETENHDHNGNDYSLTHPTSFNYSNNFLMPNSMKFKFALTILQRSQYKDQFILNSVYHIHLLLTCYKLNNIPFYSDDMQLFINFHKNSFIEVVQELLARLCLPGGWISNNTLFSLLFIKPEHLSEDSIFFDESGCSAQSSNMFEPILTIPLHNRDVLNLDYIFKHTDGYSDEEKLKSLQCVTNPIQLKEILDSSPDDTYIDPAITPDYFYTPLLDILVDDQLHGVPFSTYLALTNTSPSDLFYQDKSCRASEPCFYFLQTVLFQMFDPTTFLVDNRYKQLIQWIFTFKKKFIQLFELPQLLRHSTQTLSAQYPFMPQFSIPSGEWVTNFDHISMICQPIRPQQRGTLRPREDDFNYYGLERPFFQTATPFHLQDLPYNLSKFTTTALIENIGNHDPTRPILHDNLTQNQCSDSTQAHIINLPQSIPIVHQTISITTPQIFASLSIDTPVQLRQIYTDQLEYINMWYFHTNSIPIFLFRVERYYFIQHTLKLKFRFVRNVLALSQQTGLPIKHNFFKSLIETAHDKPYEPFSLTQADIARMPPSHRELYDLMMITTSGQDDGINNDEVDDEARIALLCRQHESKFATKIYNFQHFISLLFELISLAPHDIYQVAILNDPLTDDMICPIVSTLCENDVKHAKNIKNHSTIDFHPILTNLWRSFSTLSDYQHYIWTTMVYHREWVNIDDEINYASLFFTKDDPILNYFHYIVHMLYCSIDIQNNLPILHHFLFTVNHYSLHRRYSMLVYLARVDWDATPQLSNLEFVWYLDHIYRLVLQRCLDVDAFFQRAENKDSPPYPPNLYPPAFVAPIIHQHLEFLSCMILGSAGAHIMRPYHHDTESLVQALYPPYSQQLLLGWHNGDNVNSYTSPIEHDGVNFDLDTTFQPIPLLSLPQLNIGVYLTAISHQLDTATNDDSSSFSKNDHGIILRSLLRDGKHPILLYFKHISSISSYAESTCGSILSANCALDQEAFESGTKNMITKDIINLANTTMITIPSRSSIISPQQSPEMSLDTSNPMSLIDKQMNPKGNRTSRRSKDPLETFQPIFTEQYSFQIQYCIESFIDLMIVCDQSAMCPIDPIVKAINTNATTQNLFDISVFNNIFSNDNDLNNQHQLDFSYLAQIFNSINFTTPMDIPTTLVLDSTLPLLPDCFVERNGPGFITPLSEQYYSRQAAGVKEQVPSPTSPLPTPIQKVGQYDTPIQIPIPPYCGMIVRKEEQRFGYYQPAIFQTPCFQTFHQSQSLSDQQHLSSSLSNNLSLNPLLKTFVEYKQPTHPKKLSKETEAMMVHNISINVNQHRHRIYGSQSLLPG